MVSSATQPRAVAGIAGVALNGIAPGLFGIETGCASVGDSFAWLASITRTPLAELEAAAASRLDKVWFLTWSRANHCDAPWRAAGDGVVH